MVTIDSEGTQNHAVLEEDVEIGCLWIKPNSVLTVKSGYSLVIEDDLKLDGELRIMKDAQLIQNHTGNSLVTGSGDILIDQTFTAATVYQYNYVSSPVLTVGENFFTVADVLKDGTELTDEDSQPAPINFKEYASVSDLNGSLPTAQDDLAIANYWIFSYINGISETSWVQKKETGSFEPGEGFILKGPGAQQNYTFVGTPNDGDITINMNAYHYSLLGNPYPSALNLDEFLADNPIVNTMYFWQQTGDGGNHNQAEYQGGYATVNDGTYTVANYTVAGTIGLGNGVYDLPTNRVPVGQGFLLQIGATGGDIVFNNSQRIHEPVGNNSVFFKNNKKQHKTFEEEEVSVLKVGFEYNNSEGENIHRQVAVSFKEGNSFAQDTGFDSLMYDLDDTDVYFKFEDNRDIYVIAGVEEISPSLEVPITIVTEEAAVVYIMPDVIENIEVPIFLKDNLTNEIQEFNEPISLNLGAGTHSERFAIAFEEENVVSSEEEVLENSIKINYHADFENIQIKKPNTLIIESMYLYSNTGILMKQWKGETTLKVNSISDGVYYLKINTNKGKVTKKIVIY